MCNHQNLGLRMRLYRSLPTQKVSIDGAIDEDDFVAIETALEVRLNKKFLATFVCSPGLEKELAVGHLLSTGIIDSFDDISKVRYSSNRCYISTKDGIEPNVDRGFSQVRRFIGTECNAPEVLRELRTAEGIPSITKKVEVDLNQIFETASLLYESQTGRKKTGAMHGALLYNFVENNYVIAEDLGRHNAVDKTIGTGVQQKMDLTNCLIVSSGRLTADIVSKCAWTSVPLLISFAVSTDAGVKFAQKANMTLVGALKGRRMRIYNHGACSISLPAL
ncbi:MAG: formate dehydrogenase accessory sulfurtransferase FdhD [Candidatus Thorarchaeota archaeon]